MSKQLIASTLNQLETHLKQITQALHDPASGDLTQACNALQSAVIELARLTRQSPGAVRSDHALRLRLRSNASALTSCRESLLRRAVITQNALGALVPATRNDTYAPAVGRYARQTYGSAGRQSGEFRSTSA